MSAKNTTHSVNRSFLAFNKVTPESIHKVQKIQDNIGLDIKVEISKNNIDGFGDPMLKAVGSIPFKCTRENLAKVAHEPIIHKLSEYKKVKAGSESPIKDKALEFKDLDRSVLALCVLTKKEPKEVVSLLTEYLDICKMAA